MSARRVGVVGAAGRVGRLLLAEVIARDDLELAAAIVSPQSAAIGVDAGVLAACPPVGVSASTLDGAAVRDVDVLIDFSSPAGLGALLPLVGARALVSGTTGLDPQVLGALARQSERAPVLHASNFSTGVAVLQHLVARAAAALPAYDVEVVEVHHRHKRDAPSGTASSLVDAVARARGLDPATRAVHGRSGWTGERPSDQIGVHALRIGDVVGEHQVWIAGGGERLVLTHAAHDRAMFARGAVRAAAWLVGRSAGRYTMDDVLGLVDTSTPGR